MSSIGFALLVVAAVLAVVEAHVVSYGVLGSLAVAALAGGLALLVAGTGASLELVLAAATIVSLCGLVAGAIVLRHVLPARRSPARGGAAGLIGRRARVRLAPQPVGRVSMDGALWRARASVLAEDADLRPGDAVVVEAVDGLTLTVRPAEEWEVFP